MAESGHKQQLSADAAANRMRLLQMDFADEDAQMRQEQLCEELEHALVGRTPQQRQAFLEGLLARFPTWDAPTVAASQGAVPGALPGAVGQSPTDARELSDPSFLVSRLVELAPKFSAEQKRLLVERLRQAELLPVGTAPQWDSQVNAELLAKLHLALDRQIDSARMLSLLPALLEFALSLDQVVWRTWKDVAPRSDVRRKTGLPQQIARFASGDQKVSSEQVDENLASLRQLIAALIASIGQVGHQWASKHATRTSPEEIEALARMEKQWHEGFAVACWRKYTELAGSMDPASIERDVKQVIADYTISLIKGLAG